ncbi:nuclear transport factor 2 family protein [Georgenia sp. SYP-B2076]|uniref:nuclear transport factor 2 family protein n=1 Tax=Georgenia sp. SYP-B2076 TaxID=2495881 RepID=UPI000F8DE08E|nr:nuclear transport factor 2 family protein [Georgenia sp. SYP-B2076]
MTDDILTLHRLALEMGEAESRGDRRYFEELLSPEFVMGRPSGAVDRKEAFLAGLRADAERTTEVQDITVLPVNRALVTCVVVKRPLGDGAAPAPDGAPGSPARFHNLRVFVRQDEASPWRLIAWLNEPSRTTA